MIALVEIPIGVFQGSFLPATVVPLRIKGIKPPPDKIEEESYGAIAITDKPSHAKVNSKREISEEGPSGPRKHEKA